MSITDRQMRKTMGKGADLKGALAALHSPPPKNGSGFELHQKMELKSKTSNSDLRVGSYVHVDFISESRTQFSGQVFKGNGVIDRLEDGYAIGRLDDGRTFCCKTDCLAPLPSPKNLQDEHHCFKEWLKTTPEYRNLIFKHGERLFIRRNDEFEVLTVRLAHKAWQQSSVDQIESLMESNLNLEGECVGLQRKLEQALNHASSARVLCETACELLDDYAHQDAMVILDDLKRELGE